jgi:hypothetical protein
VLIAPLPQATRHSGILAGQPGTPKQPGESTMPRPRGYTPGSWMTITTRRFRASLTPVGRWYRKVSLYRALRLRSHRAPHLPRQMRRARLRLGSAKAADCADCTGTLPVVAWQGEHP